MLKTLLVSLKQGKRNDRKDYKTCYEIVMSLLTNYFGYKRAKMHGLFGSKENTETGLDVSFSLPTNDIRLTINFSPIKLNNSFDTLYH